MTANDQIRALVNDPQGRIWTDKHIAPFIEIAQSFLPIIAAKLIALSIGALELADRLTVLVPIEEVNIEEEKDV